MKLTYNNFLRLLLVVLVASTIVIANSATNWQLFRAIIMLAILVESLCVMRITSLGYSITEAIRRLLIKGDKFNVFLNKVPEK